MSSPEPERPEYERRVFEWSRKRFLESDPCLHNPSGGRIEFEGVRLEGAGTEDAPEQWAQMVWILLEEDILSGPRLPKKREPGSIVWV